MWPHVVIRSPLIYVCIMSISSPLPLRRPHISCAAQDWTRSFKLELDVRGVLYLRYQATAHANEVLNVRLLQPPIAPRVCFGPPSSANVFPLARHPHSWIPTSPALV